MAVNRFYVSVAAFLCLTIVLVSLHTGSCATITRKRAVDDSNAQPKKGECHKSTPCGWSIYKPFTRRVDYYMANTCECPRGTECVRQDDDLSVSAYVHRCSPTPYNDPDAELQNVSS